MDRKQGAGRGELLAARKRIAELERKVGQQELELDFFGEALVSRSTAVQSDSISTLRLHSGQAPTKIA